MSPRGINAKHNGRTRGHLQPRSVGNTRQTTGHETNTAGLHCHTLHALDAQDHRARTRGSPAITVTCSFKLPAEMDVSSRRKAPLSSSCYIFVREHGWLRSSATVEAHQLHPFKLVPSMMTPSSPPPAAQCRALEHASRAQPLRDPLVFLAWKALEHHCLELVATQRAMHPHARPGFHCGVPERCSWVLWAVNLLGGVCRNWGKMPSARVLCRSPPRMQCASS